MFRTLSQCLLPTFLRQNMFFQRVALSKITFVPASHSLPYSQLQNQPDDPSKPQRDGSWNNLFLDNIPPAQPPVKEESPEERWKRKSESARLRLDGISLPGPYSGRSVKVNGDIADAFKKLAVRLSRNRVRPELWLTERHEKKGAKRRRLKSERWRIRFADEVRKKIQLVKAIRRRGA